MSVVNAGALGRKEQQWEADFGANGNKAMKYLSRRDVPMSRRPHFETSLHHDVGSTIAKVNKPQRGDVSTSRHLNNTTWQRRDVSSRTASHHLKQQVF